MTNPDNLIPVEVAHSIANQLVSELKERIRYNLDRIETRDAVLARMATSPEVAQNEQVRLVEVLDLINRLVK